MRSHPYVYIRVLTITAFCFLIAPWRAQAQDSRNTVPASKEDSAKVNVAFGAIQQRRSTAAISTTSNEELRKTIAPTLSNALYGRIPGLTVLQGSGEPGYDAPSLYARGRSSYLSGNILTIVDGYEAPFEQMVPEEIESISLLKDAAALALYGIKAGNGVLLITTRRGAIGHNRINFSAQTGIQKPVRLQNTLGSFDYASLYNEALQNDGQSPRYTQADLDAYRLGNDPVFYPSVDWQKEVLANSAPISNYNMNFTGASETVKYFVLLNVLQNAGLYKNTDPDRKESSNAHFLKYNFRSNLEVNVSKNLTASLFLGGRVEDRTSPNAVTANQLFNNLLLTPPNAFPVRTPQDTYGGSSIYANPVGSILSGGIFNNHNRNFQSIFSLNQKLDMITPGLNIDAALSFSNFFAGTSTKEKTFAMYSLSRNALGDTIYTQIGQDSPLSGSEGYESQWRRSNAQFKVNYDRSFGQSEVTGLLMYLQDKYVLNGNNVPFAYQNFAGRLNYTFNRKYTAEVSASYSGTDNFPKNKRFGFFPAISAGWIISEEDFLRDNALFSYLKLRGSYGRVGSDQIGGQRFMYDQYYYMRNGYYFGDSNTSFGGMDEGSLANPNVTWEKKTIANLGVEANLFRNFTLTADIFSELRSDILAEPRGSVPSFLGITLPSLNEGKVRNRGFELQLGYNNPHQQNFGWFAQAWAQFARNKILYMSEAVQPTEYLYQTGRSVGQPFGLESDGFYQASDFDASGALNAGLPQPQFGPVQPGDIKYKNQNGDNAIDVYDYKAIGKSSVPEWMFGFRTGFSWKGFSLETQFQGAAGRSVYLNGTNVWAFQNNAGITPLALGRWTSATASTADYPRLTATTNENNYRLSDFWQRDGSFLKLRSVELAYELPQSAISRFRLDGMTVFANGVNLATWDSIDFADPETLSGYPAMQSFNLGVRIGL